MTTAGYCPCHEALVKFQGQLSSLKVLDPACGSGNFLYVALRQLHDLEKSVLTLAADLNLRGFLPEVSPEQCYGIEIDAYASDLGRFPVGPGNLQRVIDFERAAQGWYDLVPNVKPDQMLGLDYWPEKSIRSRTGSYGTVDRLHPVAPGQRIPLQQRTHPDPAGHDPANRRHPGLVRP